MAFIHNNSVRKPKYVAQIIVSKNAKRRAMSFSSRSSGYSNLSVVEAIRSFIKGEIEFEVLSHNVNGLNSETIEVLKELAYNFTVKAGKSNIDVYFTATKEGRHNVKLNVYFLDDKNVNKTESKKNEYDFSGDHIVLNKDAWFEDEEVFSQNYQVFFDKQKKKLIVAMHPEDVKELSKNKNVIAVVSEGVSVSGGVVSIKSSEKVEVLDVKERVEKERAEKNKTRLVVEVKKAKSKVSIPVSAFEKGKKVSRHLNFINFDIKKVADLKNGKYNIFDQNENKEFWLIVNTATSFLEETREYMVVDKGDFKEKIDTIEEIKLF